MMRYSVGHYRVPTFVRGKRGTVEILIATSAINNEEEGFGRNAGLKGYYYCVAIPMTSRFQLYSFPRAYRRSASFHQTLFFNHIPLYYAVSNIIMRIQECNRKIKFVTAVCRKSRK
jgi:hypothetical protein